MEERRKNKRVSYKAVISVDSFYNQDEIIRDEKEIPIEIVDISKGGIGFTAEQRLPVGYYFNARIHLGEDRMFYSVLHILYEAQQGTVYHYGCEFTGLADILSLYIDDYEKEAEDTCR